MIVQFRRNCSDVLTVLTLVLDGKTYSLRVETEKGEFLYVVDGYLNVVTTEDADEWKKFVEQTDDMIPMIRNIMVAGTIVSDYFEQVLCMIFTGSAAKKKLRG